MRQSAASPCLWPFSHLRAALRSQLAAHTRLPPHAVALTSQAPSPPESVRDATNSGPVPPAKPFLHPHSHARRAENREGASGPGVLVPLPASEADRTEHDTAEWLPRKAPAGS